MVSSPSSPASVPVAPDSLDRFAAAWHTLAALIARPPTQQVYESVLRLAGQWPLLSGKGPAAKAAEHLARSRASAEGEEALRQDHLRLFVGPGKQQATPYSSVYLNPSGLVFEPETLQVREFYTRFGVERTNAGKEPDDHIAAELQFLAFLANGALDEMQRAGQSTSSGGNGSGPGAAFGAARSEPPAAASNRYTEGLREFLEQHALLWHGHLGALITEQARTAFYRAVGQWLVGAAVDAQQAFAVSPDPTRMAKNVVHRKVDTSNAAQEWD